MLEVEISELRVLVNLGLTVNQAKTYLALAMHGPSKVAEIAKLSKVARSDMYQVLLRLQEHGLIEKILKNPLEYKAIPLKKGLLFLLEEKTKRYQEIRAETEMLYHIIEKEKPNKTVQKSGAQFAKISKGRPVIERIKESIEKAQTSIDAVLSWKRFSHGILGAFPESIENAWKRKVKTRFILKHPLETETARQLILSYNQEQYCQIRVINDHPDTVFGIYDNKEIFIIENPKTDLPISPALWSNNPSLIALAQNHFDGLWLKAREEI